MTQPSIKQYIHSLINPLYTKIQQLQNQNDSLKRRITQLQTQSHTLNNKSYMKNTSSRQNHLQTSRVSRNNDENRSQSGSKEKPGWHRSTKIGDDKPIVHQTQHYYERAKLKPPIPRMNSRTPTKNQQTINRQKSPVPIDKRINLNNIQADKNQSPKQPKKPIQPGQNLASPRNAVNNSRDFDDPSASNASIKNPLKLGKPNIYIQKQAKLNTVSATSPRQTPLNQSSFTENHVGRGSQIVNEHVEDNKSQLSINSDKKVVKVEVQN